MSRTHALLFAGLTLSIAPHVAAAPQAVSSPGSFEITSQATWGQLKARKAMRDRNGGAVIVLQSGDDLLVRHLASIPGAAGYGFKDTVIKTKMAGKPLEILGATVSGQNDTFVYYRGMGVNVMYERLAKVDAQGALGFDIEILSGGCFAFAPDEAGGVYTMDYAPKLASGFAWNTGRPRVSRLGSAGTKTWENIAPADKTYHAGRCAIARTSDGVLAAFSFITTQSLDDPGEIRMERVSQAGALLGASEKVSIAPAAGPPVALSLDAIEMWAHGDAATLLGRTKDNKSYLVRYDAQVKPLSAMEVSTPLIEHQGDLLTYSNSLNTVGGHRYHPTATGITKTSFSSGPVSSKPNVTFSSLTFDKGIFTFWGKTQSAPTAGFVRADGSVIGVWGSGIGNAPASVFAAFLEGTNFFAIDIANDTTSVTTGHFSFPGTSPLPGALLHATPAVAPK